MKKLFFNEKTESISVKTIWVFSVVLMFLTIPLTGPFKPINQEKIHPLKIGAFKDLPTQKTLININIALKSELIQIEGIGPCLADRIIEFRESKGPFKKLSEVSSVKGIGDRKIQRMKQQICL